MNPKTSPLAAACEVLDHLIEASEPFDGLWPSCLELESRKIPAQPHPEIPGQRDCDRALEGSNLMHDLPALGLLYELGRVQGRRDYIEAADRYLKSFVRLGTSTATGLFPWGEHSFLDLKTGQVGDCYLMPVYGGKNPLWWDQLPRPIWHDHLRQAPPWFWEKLGTFSPTAVQRFADGLDRHWLTDEREIYMRHAGIDRVMRHGFRPKDRSCDFPRHGGFYIVDLTCAHAQEPRKETLDQLWRFADYWWEKRVPNEALPFESITPKDTIVNNLNGIRSPLQTLSLALSLLEAAEVLAGKEPECCRQFRDRALIYAESFLTAPHDLGRGMFVASYRAGSREIYELSPYFGSVYGLWPVSYPAVLCCAVFRRTGDERFLRWAKEAARYCCWAVTEREKLPDLDPALLVHTGRKSEPGQAPALDAGLALELLADLHELTHEPEWLEKARAIWPVIRERYFAHGLIRLAAKGEWYEAQQGSAYLIHGAARIGLLEESSGTTIAPEYSAR
jgi:hypothetical protein